jgi:uncharacterized tellurite resistance protein B-like protein
VLDFVRTVVDALTTVSVGISLVTYYLAANRQWQVKHERAVAASISITSNGLYLLTTSLFALNMVLTAAPWQTMAETGFSLVSTVFILAVGLSTWVPGESTKGFWRRLRESLQSERRHLGALAKALTHVSGSSKIIDILTRVATVDGSVDDREKAFINVFASSWDIRVDWEEVARRGAAPAKQQYAQLRRDLEAYLATDPPEAQALQLADILVRLANADDKVTEAEALVIAELGALLEHYGENDGERDRLVYEVHIVPQSPAQDAAMTAAFPRMKRRVLPGGAVGLAATCYSPEYAEVVRSQFTGLSIYTAVKPVKASERIDDGGP